MTFKRFFWMAIGYVLMAVVGATIGSVLIVRELFLYITIAISFVYESLEDIMCRICTWDEENRQ